MTPDAWIAPHFTLHEFHCRDGTRCPESAVHDLRVIATVLLEPLRKRFGPVTVHSGFRTVPYNAQVGGARSSFHVYTLRRGKYPAVDLSCRDGSVKEWHDFVDKRQRALNQPRGGLGYYPRGGFIHCDLRPYLARWDGP